MHVLLCIVAALQLSHSFNFHPRVLFNPIKSTSRLSVGGFDYTPDEPLPKEILNPGRELTKKLAGTNVYLVGMMGSGKTAVGEKLAQNLGPYTFLDTDGIITNLLPDDVTIQDYFDSEGEDSFRKIESQVLTGVHSHVRCVVSTGGGIVKDRLNWSKMQTGLVCFLDVDLGVIEKRVGEGEGRPLLQGDGVRDKLEGIMESRRSMYEQADVTIKVKSDEEGVEVTVGKVVEELAKFIDENPPKHQQESEKQSE